MKHALTLLLAAFCLIAIGQVPDYVPTEGLVAWYLFDGDGLDQSPNGYDMFESNVGYANDRFDNPAGSLSLMAPQDYGAFPPEMVITDGEGMTMSVWAKSENWTTGNQKFLVEISDGPCDNCWQHRYALWLGTDKAHWYCEGSAGTSWSVAWFVPEAMKSEWMHLTGTVDMTTLEAKLYINGEPLASQIITTNEASLQLGAGNEQSKIIGRRSSLVPSSREFTGYADDFGIWDRALTAEEIANLFHGAAPVVGCTDLTACNYNAAAMADDGSCLFLPEASLESLVQLSNSSELEVVVPPGLSSWHWTDGDSNAVRTIQPLQSYVLEGTVGNLPQLGDELEGGLVFAIDTLDQTAYIATSEAIGSGSEWGCKFTTTGATASDFGAGWSNTELILNACSEENCAARVASALGTGWHLPSRDELEAIRTTLFETDLASYFTDNTYNWYWSSTECSSNSTAATSVHFLDGFVAACNNKDSNPGGVIAINKIERSFCAYADTLRIEIQGQPLCGAGTIWDESTEECIVANPADTNLDGCVQLNDLLDVLSAYGNCGAEEAPWSCGDPLSYQEYDYATVQIGDQCWFAENLKATHYQNDEPLLSGLSDSQWANAQEGASCVYDNDALLEDQLGRLYNFFAVTDPRGLCPSGWDVPSLEQWVLLAEQVGGASEAGMHLKASETDTPPWDGLNTTQFHGLPGGLRWNDDGTFSRGGESGYWWTTNQEEGLALDRRLYQGQEHLGGSSNHFEIGFSVRCLKNAE